MRQLTRFVTSVASIIVAVGGVMFATSGTAAATPPGSNGQTVVPMTSTLRRCDFSPQSYVGARDFGRLVALISSTGNTVIADVSAATTEPETRYVVRLIQVPRPSSMTCAGGDPGVTEMTLTTDAAGGGMVTLQGEIRPGATGAWVFFLRPGQFSQTPIVYYTSTFVAAI